MKSNHQYIENIHQYPFYKKSKRNTLIFIHIPKTGGTSISHSLGFPGPNRNIQIKKHYRVCEIQPYIQPYIWEKAFKFCFVRNPWERLYSHYRFRSRNKRLKIDAHYHSFKAWILFELTTKTENGINNLRPQLEWILSADNKVSIDFIGRFDQLKADFHKLCIINNIKASLPHLENSHTKHDYRLEYDQEMIEIVSKYYKDDISYFNFSFK